MGDVIVSFWDKEGEYFQRYVKNVNSLLFPYQVALAGGKVISIIPVAEAPAHLLKGFRTALV